MLVIYYDIFNNSSEIRFLISIQNYVKKLLMNGSR